VSWHTLAVFAIKAAAMAGENIEVEMENILPVRATEYPSAALRPYNSRLNHDKLKKALEKIVFAGRYPHWQEQVRDYVKNYVKNPF
jgi:dTDP-4-dehydrorhamnose reductase